MTVGAGRESHAEGTGPGGEGRVTGTAGLALMVPSAPPGSPVPAGPEAPVVEVLRLGDRLAAECVKANAGPHRLAKEKDFERGL